MELLETEIEGLYFIRGNTFNDIRGSFTKTYQQDYFTKNGLNTCWEEEYFTESKRNVVRGIHFQTPPFEHEKLVTCISGEILDVIVDLRRKSNTYGKVITKTLHSNQPTQVYIPVGCGHGFLTKSESAIVHYKVRTKYAPEYDRGILWNSINFEWPVEKPIISKRDKEHPRMENLIDFF